MNGFDAYWLQRKVHTLTLILHFSKYDNFSVEFIACTRFIRVSFASLVDLLTHLRNLSLHEGLTLLKHFLLWFLWLNLIHFHVTFIVIDLVCSWLVTLEWCQRFIRCWCEAVWGQGTMDQALLWLLLWWKLITR